MYVSNSAIKKLKIYLIVMSLLFIISFVFSFLGVHFQNKSWESYYEDDDVLSDRYWNLGSFSLTVAGWFMIIVAIMTFVITGIVVAIRKFKMKEDDIEGIR